VENMHMKDLAFDVKHLMEMMKACDKGYSFQYYRINNGRGCWNVLCRWTLALQTYPSSLQC